MCSGDRITDVLSVMTEVQQARKSGQKNISTDRLRIRAVSAVAERELQGGDRFKNFRSAKNTIDGSLARRLGIPGLSGFDSLLDDWLRHESRALEYTVFQKCLSENQRARARTMFWQGPGKYVIESDGRRLWVLRRFGRHGTLASGASIVSVREQAFTRLRRSTPCSLHVIGEILEEWQLESEKGEWKKVNLQAGNHAAPIRSRNGIGANGTRETGTRFTRRFGRRKRPVT